MRDEIFDMGYELFEQRDELKRTLAETLVLALSKNAQKKLFCDYTFGRLQFSGAELLAMSLALSKKIATMTKKTNIGIVCSPSIYALIANYACIFAKKVPVNLNFTMGLEAIKDCLQTADIDTMLSLAPAREKISQLNPSFPWSDNYFDILECIQSFDLEYLKDIKHNADELDFIYKNFNIEKAENGATNNKLATIIFTSGSEAKPKAAMLSERNIIANCLQLAECEVFNKEETVLANLPIFHCFGLLFGVWNVALQAQKTLSVASALDIKTTIKAIKEKEVSYMIGSPTFYRAYLKKASVDDLKSLKRVIAGAEKTPLGFEELWNNTFAYKSYFEGYGLTEATPVVSVNLPNKDYATHSVGKRLGSVGKLFLGMQARLLDPITKEVLPRNSQGLLSLRGANIFMGYLNDEKTTQESLDGDWLITGDLARIDDDGFLYIEGRFKRFSKIAGEMISHIAIENAIAEELNIADSDKQLLAISSMQDDNRGECLVLISAIDIDLKELQDICKSAKIPNIAVPKHIVRVKDIPILPTGKLDLKAIISLGKGN